MFIERHASRQPGTLDFGNRYASTVIVTSEIKEEGIGQCSGVIVDRRLILTAGHCVCGRRKAAPHEGGGGHLIDGASCARTATVETILYEPVEGVEDEAASLRSVYQGVVYPHPDLKILLGDRGEVLSSRADLALVELRGALDADLRAVPLSNHEVQSGEDIRIVGYGFDEIAHVYDTRRRFSVNNVTEFPVDGGDRGRIAQERRSLYKGDSGGPCLREGVVGSELVGISSRNLGAGSTFTSTYTHRAWVRGGIQRVRSVKPSRHRD
ncbi:MAG: trypsin-like peptidase domain-containing protein [Myxococcaceae bacterium]|nr:trypsin-like peptidase domain-containing protein [Myxococcaceae bacterium]